MGKLLSKTTFSEKTNQGLVSLVIRNFKTRASFSSHPNSFLCKEFVWAFELDFQGPVQMKDLTECNYTNHRITAQLKACPILDKGL